MYTCTFVSSSLFVEITLNTFGHNGVFLFAEKSRKIHWRQVQCAFAIQYLKNYSLPHGKILIDMQKGGGFRINQLFLPRFKVLKL